MVSPSLTTTGAAQAEASDKMRMLIKAGRNRSRRRMRFMTGARSALSVFQYNWMSQKSVSCTRTSHGCPRFPAPLLGRRSDPIVDSVAGARLHAERPPNGGPGREMLEMNDPVDVLIIGAGASGAP